MMMSGLSLENLDRRKNNYLWKIEKLTHVKVKDNVKMDVAKDLRGNNRTENVEEEWKTLHQAWNKRYF